MMTLFFHSFFLSFMIRWMSCSLHSIGFVVQGSSLARSLLLVQQVPPVAGRQAVRLQGRQDLLRPVLRLDVRHSLRRMWRNLPRRYFTQCTIFLCCLSLFKLTNYRKRRKWDPPPKMTLSSSLIIHQLDS